MKEEEGALFAPSEEIALCDVFLALRKSYELIAAVSLVSVAAAAASFPMPPVYRVSAFLAPDGTASQSSGTWPEPSRKIRARPPGQEYGTSKQGRDRILDIEQGIEALELEKQKMGGVRIVQKPCVDPLPVKPRKALNLAAAGFASPFLGAFLTFFMEWQGGTARRAAIINSCYNIYMFGTRKLPAG